MKRFFYFIPVLLLAACEVDYETPATAILNQARAALEQSQFDEARLLVDSLRSAYPKAVNTRRAALAFADSIELRNAEYDLQVSDSVLTFKRLELKDMKSQFVLEKDAKYQSVGNYVVPQQAGDKSRFRYFTEVNEQGTLVLVSIDANRKYYPTEIVVEGDKYEGSLPGALSAADRNAFDRCYSLAKLFQDVKLAEEARNKFDTKVRFFEKKLQQPQQ